MQTCSYELLLGKFSDPQIMGSNLRQIDIQRVRKKKQKTLILLPQLDLNHIYVILNFTVFIKLKCT